MNVTFPSNIPILQVGGRVFTDLANLIILVGGVGTGTNPRSTFRKVNGVAGYTPSGAKTFRCMAWRGYVNGAGEVAGLCYTDNDVGAYTNTAMTNPVYLGGDANLAPFTGLLAAAPANAPAESVIDFVLPNGKYLTVTSLTNAGSAFIHIFGYEV